MSGGKRIDDHSSFAGKGHAYPLPMGNKLKSESHAEGSGHEMDYQDTNEEIVKTQGEGDAKAKRHKLKSGYRY